MFGYLEPVTDIYDGQLAGILSFEETFSNCPNLKGEAPELWESHRSAISSCIACGACVDECPVGCISDAGGIFKISAAECIDCGACEGSCPNGSIKPE